MRTSWLGLVLRIRTTAVLGSPPPPSFALEAAVEPGRYLPARTLNGAKERRKEALSRRKHSHTGTGVRHNLCYRQPEDVPSSLPLFHTTEYGMRTR